MEISGIIPPISLKMKFTNEEDWVESLLGSWKGVGP